MEEGFALGVDPDYEPMFKNENIGTIMALITLLAFGQKLDFETLRIAIDAIEKEKNAE